MAESVQTLYLREAATRAQSRRPQRMWPAMCAVAGLEPGLSREHTQKNEASALDHFGRPRRNTNKILCGQNTTYADYTA